MNANETLHKYYVRLWCDGVKEWRMGVTDKLDYNDVFCCYEGHMVGRHPDEVFTRLNECYISPVVKRCGRAGKVA